VNEPTEELREYSSHKEQVLACGPPEERTNQLRECLVEAYKKVILYKEVPVITFGDMNAEELAEAFVKFPIIIKPTLSCVNIAGRAIKRDLGIDLNMYAKKISPGHAKLLAGYVKPLLPPEVAIPALMELDRYSWTDKAMRATKGSWEKQVAAAIHEASGRTFKKRTFDCEGQGFEIDIAYPASGHVIDVAIDVKRIEAQQDTQKRADEIVNKAAKFKRVYPNGRFFAVVYYPFQTQHINLRNRLADPRINNIFFAGATLSSIAAAAEMLVGALGFSRNGPRIKPEGDDSNVDSDD
jgi:hypothetical protein